MAAHLSDSRVMAFAATRDAARAKQFYGDVLGLRLVHEDPFGIQFDGKGGAIRIAVVPELTPAGYTVLGWHVTNIRTTINELTGAGVRFERYDGMQQDELGIWAAPGGGFVAWFKDPDGNTLSLTQSAGDAS
jgi:catechol 2,3-dioxygenase-like lactoylglutathione lyase family enzyme